MSNKYQIIGAVLHPDKTGWTKEMYPQIWEQYNKVVNSILTDKDATIAKEILSTYFKIDGAIEIHNRADELFIDNEGDGIFLLKKINI